MTSYWRAQDRGCNQQDNSLTPQKSAKKAAERLRMTYMGDEGEAACKGGCRREKLQRPRSQDGRQGKGPSQNLDCVWEIALGRPKQASINEWP